MPQPNCICCICKKPIYRIPSRQNGHNTCSISCRNKYFSNDKSFVWKGGKDGLNKRKKSINGRQKERERIKNRKEKVIQAMGGECQCCGYNRHTGSLECHHIDPTQKEKNVRDLIMKSWEKIEEEIKKCILLCANCHREIHWRMKYEHETTREAIQKLSKFIQTEKLERSR